MPLILPTRNPLAYPGGAPGFDPTHPLAVNVRSSVAGVMGANFRDVLTGQPGVAESSSASFKLDGFIGPSYLGTNTGFTGKKFANKSTVNDTSITLAFIGVMDGSGNRNYVSTNSDQTTGGWTGGCSSGGKLLIQEWKNSGFKLSTIGLTAGDQYFVGISTDSATVCFVLCNLRTGKITSETLTQAFTSAAPNGTHLFGGSGTRQLNTTEYQSTGMSAGMFLREPQLRAVAADPWSFWYPRRQYNIVGAAAAGFPWWAVKNNSLIGAGLN